MNKAYFKRLLVNKNLIEEALGQPLEWQELPDNKMSRIKIEMNNLDFPNEIEWPKRNEFFIEMLPKFQAAFDPFVIALR